MSGVSLADIGICSGFETKSPIRYTPSGGTAEVTLTTRATEGARILVANPGGQISAEHLPKLFDRFYRVDASRQRSDEGAGLGLAIVKSIVDVHQGEIGVRSSEAGTVFEISLPNSGGLTH